ncbi:hypothetical protein GGQ80_001104 [Sphingomonas jinjuensis]|uniref:MlaB-like STAS domain-containing protein n=1 Tax=Sphingomonas jinjuensis TaxID=535907 RepID=A0A840FAA3_9SPHN|nr:STAS domain-containing protein [Sphingomonas jinjuensis]MBB4153216.1 hypothetical protein [Sphingomonas jinjuensis]
MSITTVTAKEDVCLPSIGALAADLRDALADGGAVQLDLSQATSPDLSVVQLVQSARVTAARNGADFTLAHPADETLRALLDRAGFLTDPIGQDFEFWFHGETAQ